MVDRVDINRLLLEMRTLKSQTQAFGGVSPLEGKTARRCLGVAFGDVMSQAVNKVNEVQQASIAPCLSLIFAATAVWIFPM